MSPPVAEGVSILKINALSRRRCDALAGQQDAVGALIGDDFGEGAARLGTGTGIERIDDSHHIGGAGIVQRNHLNGFIAALVHALDDAHHAAHIAGAIRDDQHVAGRDRPPDAHRAAPAAAASVPAAPR